MPSVANVRIHASQFPENVRRDLIESLRTRQANHKFHYDSVKQTQKWLALHQAYSPSRNDADCAVTYDQSFRAAATRIQNRRVHLIGLGCGGGQKDTRLLSLFKTQGAETFYTPCDVSTAMVLTARETALATVGEEKCFPLVCDLAQAKDLPDVLQKQSSPDSTRLITFFGMIPNFEPEIILPRLAALARPGDYLLFSANLAPGPEYPAGLRRILPQYDNPLTRDWLLTFLLDLGVDRDDGEVRFQIEDGPLDIRFKRVAASFHFLRSRAIVVEPERFEFHAGDMFRLFYSYRYTPALVSALLEAHGLHVMAQWITKSQEEGVFLCSCK
jgi:L-histidine Nalpha-methyltransferase